MKNHTYNHKIIPFSSSTLIMLLLAMLLTACQSPTPNERLHALDFEPFTAALAELDEAHMQSLETQLTSATILDIQSLMATGELNAETLTLYYLSRIQKYDSQLNSVLELNPEALTIAIQLDAERAAGQVRGNLHGVPILLKDNIATGDQLHNTAGAAALADHRAPRDSFIAAQLRDAGAIILGKTNMSEWAYFMSQGAPSGYSALGGQAINPYSAKFEVYGSSTGSAIAASAHFAAATVGTETTGSIVAPASVNGIAGMRPTLGLVSGDLIIPITAQLDSAGPMGRNITDIAVLLTAMSQKDNNDPLSILAEGTHGTDFITALDTVSLDGLKIGLPYIDGASDVAQTRQMLATTIDILEKAGATVIDIPINQDESTLLFENQLPILAGSMAADVAHYLESAQAPIESLEAIIAFNETDRQQYALFGQDLLEMSVSDAMDSAAHEALSVATREHAQSTIRQATVEHQLDVILSFENEFSIFYALAGYPAVTVPIGLNADGQPQGATFVGLAAGTDAQLLGIAFAFEQESNFRVEPLLQE